MNNYYIEYGEFNAKCADLDIAPYLYYPHKIKISDKDWIEEIEEVFKKYSSLSAISISTNPSYTIYIFYEAELSVECINFIDDLVIPEEILDFISNMDKENDIIIRITTDY